MNHTDYFLLALSFLPAMILLCSAALDREHSLLSPFWSMLFPVIVGCPLKIILFLSVSGSEPLARAFAALSLHDLTVTLLMISAFFLMTSLTYFLLAALGKHATTSAGRRLTILQLNRSLLLIITLVVITTSLISLYLFLKASGGGFESLTEFSGKRRIAEQSGVTSSGGIYRAFTNLAKVNTLLLFSVWLRFPSVRRDASLLTGLVIGTIVTAIISAALSERTSFALLLIPLVGGLKLEKVITGFHIVVAMTCALIFANAVVILRSASESQDLSVAGLLKSSNEIPLRLTESINGTDITKVTRIRKHFDSHADYFYGQSLVTWPIVLIPKRIWPEKPELNLDRWVTRVIYGGIPDVNMGALPPSLVGECYMNGGWAGILLGAIVYGACLRLLIARMFPGENSTVFSVFFFFAALPLFTHLVNMADFGPSMLKLCVDVGSGLLLLQIYGRLGWQTRNVVRIDIEQSMN